jgi:cold-inducible RNA-binding protein
MSKKLYVGNLAFQTTEEELNGIFSQFGAVESVTIITDRDTGRSKGFGFVVMEDADADKAIEQLNGSQLGGRNLTVNEARPMVKREFTSRAGRNNRW